MTLLPLARTPMDKKSGQAMQAYARDVERMLSDAAPWLGRKRTASRGKVKPGEVAVILGPGDSPNDPLYKLARIKRE